MEIPDPQSRDRMHYDAELGSLKAEVHAIHKRLDGIADDIRASRRPQAHIYAITVAATGVLVTIFTLALNPVSQNLSELVVAFQRQQESFHEHTSDGHPGAVIDKINTLNAQHIHERERLQQQVHSLRETIEKENRRVTQAIERLSNLEVIAKERTIRFKRVIDALIEKIDIRAADRWTGGQQDVYSQAVDDRIKKLESHAHQ